MAIINRDTLITETALRLKDPTFVTWGEAELRTYINTSLEGLYPTYFKRLVATTIATAGPMQTLPPTASNLYMVAYKKVLSKRARSLRRWAESNGEAYIPRTTITGDTLIWCWTAGWAAPETDIEALTLPVEVAEAVVLRAAITAIERLLLEKERLDQYLAIQAREDVSEADLGITLDALHATLDRKTKAAHPLPVLYR